MTRSLPPLPPINGVALKILLVVVPAALVGFFSWYGRDITQSERISRMQSEVTEHVRSSGHSQSREDIRDIAATQRAMLKSLDRIERKLNHASHRRPVD